MTNEKRIWLCEQYAQKAWTLSLALAQEAARAGHFGKGYAVVAEEIRTLANKLFEYTAKVCFDGEDSETFNGIADFATMMCFLSTNTMLEIMRVNPIVHDMTLNKSMTVLAEDLRRLSMHVSALTDDRANGPVRISVCRYNNERIMLQVTFEMTNAPIRGRLSFQRKTKANVSPTENHRREFAFVPNNGEGGI